MVRAVEERQPGSGPHTISSARSHNSLTGSCVEVVVDGVVVLVVVVLVVLVLELDMNCQWQHG